MGISYKGGVFTYHCLSDNASYVKEKYEFNSSSGYFGQKSGHQGVREYKSDDPLMKAKEFYDAIANGGIESVTETKDGQHSMRITRMKDGTIIIYREISRSGPPSVEINIKKSTDSSGIKEQKIHFIKE